MASFSGVAIVARRYDYIWKVERLIGGQSLTREEIKSEFDLANNNRTLAEKYLFRDAQLVLRLHKAIKTLLLTQSAAARRIGSTQPELSKILRGKFSEVSLERLMRFLTALGCHIEIKIQAAKPRKAGIVTVRDARQSAA
jgi:predicted XRE-type DNA-binding protein